MTNGFVAALFTTGMLKLIRTSDFSVRHEIDLVQEPTKKVIDGMIRSHTCSSVINNQSIDKTIRLCVAFCVESQFGKSWTVSTFD
jgi:hypothetical protein